MKKGIFWRKGDRLIAVAAACTAEGLAEPGTVFSSKSGTNFNHRAEWKRLDRDVTEGLPWNTYPRGRVEIRGGKATIYLNPGINNDAVLEEVLETFELRDDPGLQIRVVSDGSAHYRYAAEKE